jgi:hypothetical protein
MGDMKGRNLRTLNFTKLQVTKGSLAVEGEELLSPVVWRRHLWSASHPRDSSSQGRDLHRGLRA